MALTSRRYFKPYFNSLRRFTLIFVLFLSSLSFSQERIRESITDDFGYIYKAKVIDVYDGDTVTLILDLGFNIKFTEKIRLAHINAPEVRGKSRPEGLKSRDVLRRLILNKKILIETLKDKRGKYGRIVGSLYMKDSLGDYYNVNQYLVDNGYAKKRIY